jgi:hypothetical protein
LTVLDYRTNFSLLYGLFGAAKAENPTPNGLQFFRVSEKLAAVNAPWEDLDPSIDAATKDEVVSSILNIPQVRFRPVYLRKIVFTDFWASNCSNDETC